MKAQGNTVIHADQKRVQVVRHRVGQLDSVKALPYEELELLRTENAERLKVLEEMYWGGKENKEAGDRIRERYSKPNEGASTF